MFEYSKTTKIFTWDVCFDSFLELKFVFTLIPDWEFIRNGLSIYYDPKSLMPVTRIKGSTRRYTPDFLIRHKKTNEAFLIEVKPEFYTHDMRLEKKSVIANNFIASRNYDWRFKMIFSNEICLSFEQLALFNEYCRHLKYKNGTYHNHISPSLLNKTLSLNKLNDFVFGGTYSTSTKQPLI